MTDSENPDDADLDDPEFRAWATKFDELDARATAAHDRGDARGFADAAVDIAVHLLEGELIEEAIDAMIAARDAFLDVPGAGEWGPVESTECAYWAANLAMRIGDYETALAGFGAAADEYRSRDMPGHAAENENNRGAAATQLGLFAAAEEALHRAATGYRQLRMTSELPGVRINLANVYRLSGRQDLAEAEYLDVLPMFPRRSEEAAKCTASLAGLYTEQQRVAEARAEYAKAIALFTARGVESDVLDCELILAHLDLLDGDARAAAERGERVRAGFARLERPEKVAACDVNLANFYLTAGRYSEADAAFERGRTGLIDTGLAHNLPNLEWGRFKRFLSESAEGGPDRDRLGRAALEAGVASVIGTDHQRFQFPDAHRRIRWRDLLTTRLSAVFDAAFMLGDTELLADLIEVGLNAGVYGAPESDGAVPDGAAGVPGAADAADGLDLGPAGPPTVSPDQDPENPDGGALTLGAASLLATAELPLAPPPALWTAGASRAGTTEAGEAGTAAAGAAWPARQILGRYREIAGTRNPALAAVLRTRPGVAIW